jgi:hypothetical protein
MGIVISTSTYNLCLNSKQVISRLSIGDDTSGVRIVGGKYSDFPSTNWIDVDLNVKQAKQLVNELNKLISKEEKNG